MEKKKTKKADLENKRVLFLELGLIAVLGIVLLAFEWTSRPNESQMFADVATEDVGEQEIIPPTKQEQPQEAPPPPPEQSFEFLNVVEDDVEILDQLELDDVEASDDMAMEIIPFDDEEEIEEEQIFMVVEDMPQFQGGDLNTFRIWVQENLRYPGIAAENGIQGRVYVQFAVNSKGQVVDAKVLRPVDPLLDKEALRVVNTSPKWTPGKQRGRPVKVQYNMPISFVLQ